MPRSLVPLFLVLALVAGCGSPASTPDAEDTSPPKPSAVGAPTGEPVMKAIGAAGGSVTSADGLATVTIPAGALAADTSIGIQPITNTATSGIGVAYRLTPDGQTFTQPVQLTFPYSTGDLNGTFAEALGIAYQDADGRWEWQDSVALDTAAKTVTVTSTHFTDWAKVARVQLKPNSATIKLNDKLRLTTVSCIHRVNKATYVRDVCRTLTDEHSPIVEVLPNTWAVDGAPGGTTGHGLVSGDNRVGVYTAPAARFAAPAGRLVVAVSVQVKTAKGTTMLLVSNVTILSGYHVVGALLELNSGHVCEAAVSAQVTDMVTFTVSDTNSGYAVTDIKNFPSVHTPAIITVIGKAATMIKEPDVFDAEQGVLQPLSGSDLITVSVKGKLKVGSCSYLGQTIGVAGTYDDVTGVAFHTTDVPVDGDLKVKSDTGDEAWTWTISAQ